MQRFLITLLMVCSLADLHAQRKQNSAALPKKPLTHDVYDSWKEIPFKTLTPDGSFAIYAINPQDGDGQVTFHNLKSGTKDVVARAADIEVAYDGAATVFKIKPPQALVKEMKRQKKKKDEMPKDSLGVYLFSNRKVEKIPLVKSYKLPEKAGGWLAYQLEPVKNGGDSKKKSKKNSDENGFTLVLRNLNSGKETQFGYVKDYVFAENGNGLLMSSTGNDSTMQAGVYWFDLANATLKQLHRGHPKFQYKGLSVSEQGDKVSFLLDADTTKALIRHFELLYGSAAGELKTFADTNLTGDWLISENRSPTFSKDGAALYFGTAPALAKQDTSLLPEEIVNVEIWGGDDDYIYPQQNSRLQNEKKRSYLASISLASNSFAQLGSPEIPDVNVGDEGNATFALGESDAPYRKMITWDVSAFSDFYLIDRRTGASRLIAKEVKGNARYSPKAKYVFWFSHTDTAWVAYAPSTGETRNLTKSLDVTFADEEDDHPDYPGPYGFAGWTESDESFLVYDRYDIWQIDPSGRKPAINITQVGRGNKMVFRYIKLDPEERNIDSNGELLLSAFNEVTRESGFYKLSVATRKLTPLAMGKFRHGTPVKAREGNQLLFTRESFQDFPDLWVSDVNLGSPKKITEANPQMKDYLWGSVELVRWVSLDNIPLEGLLYKPENFDPARKYPMIVNFYERSSDGLYQHHEPEPHRSTINKTFYTSNGYIVFVPDVVYKIGFPGESAYNCVMPGIASIVSKGFVDEKNIGLQGHSWGGYQIAYLVTRTNLFKAAEAGAPVANMISAYGGIRWESGLSRMFQYEHTQSRIGGTLWEKPLLYIENSPIFFADKIQTPILLLHNDSDGAVPWYQGIEMYMAMRRLDKPVWMLNYNGEPHWPLKRQNRIDFQTRMKQFFDHYLKGAPMPEWMSEGVPAIEKGINKGY